MTDPPVDTDGSELPSAEEAPTEDGEASEQSSAEGEGSDDDASDPNAEVRAGVAGLRNTMRWVMGVFSAVAVAAIGKVAFFTDVGALGPKNADLARESLILAFIGLALAICAAAQVYRGFQPSLRWIQSPWHWRIRRQIEGSPDLLGGYSNLADLSTELTSLLSKYRLQTSTPDDEVRLDYAERVALAIEGEAAFQRTSHLFSLATFVVILGAFCVALGLFGYIFATSRDKIDNLGKPYRPALTAELRSSPRFALHIEASTRGVRREGGVLISVIGEERGGRSRELYRARLGPHVDGTIDHSVDIPLEYGRYDRLRLSATLGRHRSDCAGSTVNVQGVVVGQPKHVKNGCLVIRLPRPTLRPQIQTSWTMTNPRHPVFSFDARNDSLGPESQLVVAVVVFGHGSRLVYLGSVGPSPNGSLTDHAEVTLTPTDKVVCLVARGGNGPSAISLARLAVDTVVACPPADETSTAVARAEVPDP